MASTATTRGKYRKQGLGDNLNAWGLTNGLNGLFDVMDEGIHGVQSIALTGNYTLTSTNYTTNDIRNRILRFTDSSLSAAPTITIPATENWWLVNNATTYALTFDNGSNTASIAAGREGLVWTDGTTVWSLSFFESADQTYPAGLNYTFSTTTTDADPGSGNLRLDNATASSATGIYISDNDAGAVDVSAFLLTWDDSTSATGGQVFIQSIADSGVFHIYDVTAITDNTGYVDATVSHIAGNGSFTNGGSLVVTFIRQGDKGDTGATGSAGTVSAAGDGTVSAPGISWDADGDTGFYRKSSGVTGYTSDGTNTVDFGPTTSFKTAGEALYLAEGNTSTDRSYDETTARDISLTATADFNIDFETPNTTMVYSHVLWITQDGTGGRTITIRDGSNTGATWLGTEPDWASLAASALTIVSVFYAPSGTLYAVEVTQ